MMAKIEILLPNGRSCDKENRVYEDGKMITGITDLVLRIPVGDIPEITITRNILTQDGEATLIDGSDGEKEIAKEVIRFVGSGFERVEE
jgi:hypothetical protein